MSSIVKKPNGNDNGIDDWKRVRSQIEHENTLINHRLSWLFSSQAFLFGAFIYILQATITRTMSVPTAAQQGQGLMDIPKIQGALAVIALVGIAICSFIMVMLDAAHKQIRMLEDWWIHYYLRDLKNAELYKIECLKGHPPINGLFDELLYRALSTRYLPITLIFGWVFLFSVVILERILNIDKPIWGAIAATLAFAFFSKPIYNFLLKKKARPDRAIGNGN